MTIEQSPVAILGDLIEQLESKIDQYEISTSEAIARAYAAGADQELKACCEWMASETPEPYINALRDARRPKALSLKKLAYHALDTYIYGNPDPKDKEYTYNAIRRALEQLND